MNGFSEVRSSIDSLKEHLRARYKAYAGAKFKVALVRQGGLLHYLTGCIEFCSSQTPSREMADYGGFVFVEEWCRGQSEALNKTSDFMVGREKIEGIPITSTFSQSRWQQQLYPAGDRLWTGEMLRAQQDTSVTLYCPTIMQGPLLAFGLEPFPSTALGVNKIVFDNSYQEVFGLNIPNQDELLICLPDDRARVLSAIWTPGKLKLDLEINVPTEQLQVQVVHTGSKNKYQFIQTPKNLVEVEVPNDTRELLIYLISDSHECISQINLLTMYKPFGTSPRATGIEELTLADLSHGEGDQVEYKPFMTPGHEKEESFVETVIAFANTSGGRIYVGVKDRGGVPHGASELRKTFKKGRNEKERITQQVNQLKWLITNKIVQAPTYEIEVAHPYGDPVIAVKIEPATSRASTYDNQVFVRRGATNVRPTPQVKKSTLDQLLS